MPVVDASVALKWFIEEPGSRSALALRSAHIVKQTPLLAPDLIIYEVANALLHNARFSDSDVLHSVQTLYDLQIEIITPTDELTNRAIRLASRYKLTFHDALYVAVAQEVETDFVTSDRQLHRKIIHLSFVHILE